MTQPQLVAENGPKSYPPETLLTFDQLLDYLQISRKVAERRRLADKIPFINLGKRSRRYLMKHVLEFLDEEAGK